MLALVIGARRSHHQAKRILTFCAGARLGGSCGPGRLAFCRPVLTCSRFLGHLMPLKAGISRTLRVVFVALILYGCDLSSRLKLRVLAGTYSFGSRVVEANSESFCVSACSLKSQWSLRSESETRPREQPTRHIVGSIIFASSTGEEPALSGRSCERARAHTLSLPHNLVPVTCILTRWRRCKHTHAATVASTRARPPTGRSEELGPRVALA